MCYPDQCIRGIPNSDFLLGEGDLVDATLFSFHREREDGWAEESINWMDSPNVVSFTLDQTNEKGEPKFKVGIAIIPRFELDKIKKRPGFRNLFDYERSPIEDNPYHGNLLLKVDIETRVKKMARSALALAAQVQMR